MSQTKAQLVTVVGGVGNGTAGAPALTGDDTDTGISFGTNTVTTSTGGSARTTVDGSGRLLVGSTSYTGNATILAQGHSGSSSGPGHVLIKRGDDSVGADTDLGYLFFSDSNSSGGFAAWIRGMSDGGTWTSGSSMPGKLIFATTANGASAPTERMRLKSDGDVVFTVRGGDALELGGGTNHSIYRAASNMCGIHFSDHAILPTDGSGTVEDNAHDVGNSSYRWDDIWATNGTIETSDQNLKQDVAQLTDAELAAAKAIRGLVKTYRWIDSVEEKGDEARIHVGVIAQEVEQAFIDQGLDPTRYALFCKDSWYAVDGKAMGNNGETYTEDTPGAVFVERRGVRYQQLLAFVMAAVDAEAAAFEARLAALEAN